MLRISVSSVIAIFCLSITIFCLSFATHSFAKDNALCQSPLYVSATLTTAKTSASDSLSHYFAYFDRKGQLDIARKQLLSSGYFTTKVIGEGLGNYITTKLLQNPDTPFPQGLDVLFSNHELISDYRNNIPQLIEAIRLYEIDPNLDFTEHLGKRLSIIDHFVQVNIARGDLKVIEELIYVGVPITPAAIYTTIDIDSPLLLTLLLQHFDDENPNYRTKAYINDTNAQLSYAEHAAAYGSLEALELVLDAGIGSTDRILEALLSSYTRFISQTADYRYYEKIANYNAKLELLLNLGFIASSKTLLDASNDLKPHLNTLSARLVELAKTSQAQALNEVEMKVANHALDYLEKLKQAKNRWPYFTFSYDSDCQKVPADSHYRLDNLLTTDELKQHLASFSDKKPIKISDLFKAKGDIYVDWYNFSQLKAPTKMKHQVVDDVFEGKVYERLELNDWYGIDELFTSFEVSETDMRVMRNRVLNWAMLMDAPAHITDSWLENGAIVKGVVLDDLFIAPKFAHKLTGKLERQSLTLKHIKSALFRAAKSQNLQLIETLLSSKTLDSKHKTDQGMSALTWTLLNYHSELKPQLQLLLKFTTRQQAPLTKVQQNMLKRVMKEVKENY